MSIRTRFLLAAVLLCVAAPSVTARELLTAETFKVQNVSPKYDLVVEIEGCGGPERSNDPNNCNGKARVSIFRKGEASPFQVLRLPNVELYKDTAAYSPKTSAKPRGLYEEEYSFVFDDFNFDGEEDLAICNGRNGGYGGPSYTIFLFDKKSGRFAENRRLSRLNDGPYLSLFFPDPKKKTLAAFSKSGCCYHETGIYRVVNDRPVLVEKIIEDAYAGNGKFLMVTTKKLVKGRWITRIRKEKISDDEQD